MVVIGLTVLPWTRLLPPLLLRPVIVLPHLKRRPVNRPRMPLHNIDPDTTSMQDPFIFINGEIRPGILRRPMRHRRRPKNMHRQVSPVGNPRWQIHFLLVPRCSPLPIGPAVMCRSQHDEIVGSAKASHCNVKIHFLDALGVVHHEALKLLAALAEGKVAQEGVYVVSRVLCEEVSCAMKLVRKVASVVELVVFHVWLDETFVKVADVGGAYEEARA